MQLFDAQFLIAIFLIIAGMGMIGLWTVTLIKREEDSQVSRDLREIPLIIKAHIIAELATGGLALIAGILMVAGITRLWILTPVAIGLVFYAGFQASAYSAAGYYGGKPMTAMLTIITILAGIAAIAEIWYGALGLMPGIQYLLGYAWLWILLYGVFGFVIGTQSLLGLAWLWILISLVLGMALYAAIQTTGSYLHEAGGRLFGKPLGIVLLVIVLIIVIATLILYLP